MRNSAEVVLSSGVLQAQTHHCIITTSVQLYSAPLILTLASMPGASLLPHTDEMHL